MRRGGTILGGLLVAACAVAAACSSFEGDGNATTAAADGGSDGGPDATVTPAPPPGPDDAGATSCASDAHAICDDFEGHDLPGPWDGFTVTAPAQMAITTTDKSSSHVLAFTQPEITSGPSGSAFVTKTINGADLTHVACSLSLYINALGMTGATVGSLLHYGILTNVSSEAKAVYIDLNPGANTTYFVVDTTYTDGGGDRAVPPSPGPLKNGVWQRVGLDVDFKNKVYTLTVDGSPILQGTLGTGVSKSNGVRVVLGLVGSSFLNDYLVDDFVCDVLP